MDLKRSQGGLKGKESKQQALVWIDEGIQSRNIELGVDSHLKVSESLK